MSEREPDDDFLLKVEDMREPLVPGPRLALGPVASAQRTARQRTRRRIVVACVLALLVVALLASLPAVRQGAARLARSL